MAKKRRYDDQTRASAVIMLQAAGYPKNKGALERVAAHLKIPRTTLAGWANGHSNPPPTDLRLEKKEDLIGYIKRELACIFNEMDKARPEASYRDLTVATGILVDKWQLLAGDPTDRHELKVEHELDADTIAEAVRILGGANGCSGCRSQEPDVLGEA